MEGGSWQKTSQKLGIGVGLLELYGLENAADDNADCSVTNPLPDPILELHSAGGQIIASNDNWQTTRKAQIIATGLAPADPHESAIFAILPATILPPSCAGLAR
jgi:hypothetical protein